MPRATKATASTKGTAATRRSAAGSARSTKSGGAKKAAAPTKATRKAPATTGTTKRSSKRPPLDKFLTEMQALLRQERDAYTRQAEVLKAEADQLAEEMEPGDVQFDEESGEGATMNVERERDLTLSAQARAAVEEIDRALAKIDAGTYGTCERCGHPIARARLKALPYASQCVACKSGGLLRR